eukprot:m.1562418 g.1562418  ORF g.1562418 m.1562418 type:complete len:85 (-) comp25281_c0_seq19:376-630(-)
MPRTLSAAPRSTGLCTVQLLVSYSTRTVLAITTSTGVSVMFVVVADWRPVVCTFPGNVLACCHVVFIHVTDVSMYVVLQSGAKC